MTHLFSPISLGPLQLSNRIAIAPMCQYSADEGLATDWHMIHLGHLALSGAGLLMLEATAVLPEGRISPADLGLWSDAHAAALAPIVQSIRKYAPIKLAIQLGHAGRKASSAVPWEGGANIAPGRGRLADRGAIKRAARAWRDRAHRARCGRHGARDRRFCRGGQTQPRTRFRRH